MAGERKPSKPQGASGPLLISAGSIEWEVIAFPDAKDERELLVGQLFMQAASNAIRYESTPSLRPFSDLRQNSENDLDLTVTANDGDRLMELAEFAPLRKFGPKFADVPTSIGVADKVDQAEALVRNKSKHQGGAGRLLLLYTTEQAFELTGSVIEALRRRFAGTPPSFDRVYYALPVRADIAIAHELYPGKPHEWFGDLAEDKLLGLAVLQPHPRDLGCVRSLSWRGATAENGAGISYTVSWQSAISTSRRATEPREQDGGRSS